MYLQGDLKCWKIIFWDISYIIIIMCVQMCLTEEQVLNLRKIFPTSETYSFIR